MGADSHVPCMALNLKQHLERLKSEYPVQASGENHEEPCGKDTVDQRHALKGLAISVFKGAGFDIARVQFKRTRTESRYAVYE